MFIFKPYNHDELDQMVISQDINKLKEHAKMFIDGELEFNQRCDCLFVECKGHEIGVIGPIEEI